MDLTELRRTISLCKEGINSADLNLIKLTGRSYDKNENLPNNQRFLNKRRINMEHEPLNEIKKPRNDKDGPSLNSVVQITKGRTRDDALTELKNKENPKEKERCKRLFGHLMGTLNSIKKDAEKSSNDPQNITRLKIEKKVEAGNKLINETIQKEQNELLRSKRERQNDLKILNQRYRAAEAFDRWRNEKEKMKGFIRTAKAPFVFYRPKIINEEAQLRIDQTTREIDTLIETRKKKLESEIVKAVKYSEQHLEGGAQRNEARGDEIGDFPHGADEKSGSYDNGNGGANNKMKMGARSPAGDSLASEEDYEDMIEEIEISMHDEGAAVHEEDAPSAQEGIADVHDAQTQQDGQNEHFEQLQPPADEQKQMESEEVAQAAHDGEGTEQEGKNEEKEKPDGEEEEQKQEKENNDCVEMREQPEVSPQHNIEPQEAEGDDQSAQQQQQQPPQHQPQEAPQQLEEEQKQMEIETTDVPDETARSTD